MDVLFWRYLYGTEAAETYITFIYFHPVIHALEFFWNYYAPQTKYLWQIVATNCKSGLAVKRLKGALSEEKKNRKQRWLLDVAFKKTIKTRMPKMPTLFCLVDVKNGSICNLLRVLICSSRSKSIAHLPSIRHRMCILLLFFSAVLDTVALNRLSVLSTKSSCLLLLLRWTSRASSLQVEWWRKLGSPAIEGPNTVPHSLVAWSGLFGQVFQRLSSHHHGSPSRTTKTSVTP